MLQDIPEFDQDRHRRALPILLGLIVLAVGFGRIEDRAIIVLPKLAATTMAAIGIVPEAEEEDISDPENVVPVSNASRLPTNRTRRILRERAVASKGVEGITPGSVPSTVQEIVVADGNPASQAVTDAFALPDVPAIAALVAPALLPVPNPVFSGGSTGNPGGGGGGGGGGGTGGPGSGPPGGGGPGGANPPGVVPTAVPEPASWLMLLFGFAFVAGALRSRKASRPDIVSRTSGPRRLHWA